VIEQLLGEHRKLEAIVQHFRSGGLHSIAPPLTEFAELLEAHIRKEERALFSIYERYISPVAAEHVEQEVLSLIGAAIRPKHPELLEA
jgi:hemerythrin-like domain-containing protein